VRRLSARLRRYARGNRGVVAVRHRLIDHLRGALAATAAQPLRLLEVRVLERHVFRWLPFSSYCSAASSSCSRLNLHVHHDPRDFLLHRIEHGAKQFERLALVSCFGFFLRITAQMNA